MEKTISLNGLWQARLPDCPQPVPFPVPGCVETVTARRDIGTPVHIFRSFPGQPHKAAYLHFGGVSYFCQILLNGALLYEHEGIWDGFWVDVTGRLQEDNLLELVVTKPGYYPEDPYPLREVLSGFIPDVACSFGGPWDDVSLILCDASCIASLTVSGDRHGNYMLDLTAYGHGTGTSARLKADISLDGRPVATLDKEITLSTGENTLSLSGHIDNPALWGMETPTLYTARVTLWDGQGESTQTRAFGFRTIESRGSHILLNGRPVYPRGILHWGYYDDTIIPNPSREQIREELKRIAALGFNMVKHCLYIPRRTYLEEMDRAGLLAWVELPLWLPEGSRFAEHMRREYPPILRQLAGHPSLVLLSLGCELDDTIGPDILSDMYTLAKGTSGALVRDNSGSGECYGGLRTDFADYYDYHFYADLHQMEPLMETFTPGWRGRRPWVFGEFCDVDNMRDLAAVRKDKGADRLWWESGDPQVNPICNLKPDFYAQYHDQRWKESGIRAQSQHMMQLSMAHSLAHRKTMLEQTRAFPEIGGYNITVLRDVPIATSGLFDDMGRCKVRQDDYLPFNSDTVLCPAWDLSRVWICSDRVQHQERYNFWSGSRYALTILCSHYGPSVLQADQLTWRLLENDAPVLEGSLPCGQTVTPGQVVDAGYIAFSLPQVHTLTNYVLEATLAYGEQSVSNRWPVYVYPRPDGQTPLALYDPCNLFAGLETLYPVTRLDDEQVPGADTKLVVTARLTPAIKRYMEAGGRVFLMQRGEGVLPADKICFWREAMFTHDPSHPVTQGLHEGYLADLRYFGVGTDTALRIQDTQVQGFTDYRTLIRRYDCRTWLIHDYMAEMNYGRGRLVATTLRLEGGAGKQPMGLSENPLSQWLLSKIFAFLTQDASV